jgi:hypothetical protein
MFIDRTRTFHVHFHGRIEQVRGFQEDAQAVFECLFKRSIQLDESFLPLIIVQKLGNRIDPVAGVGACQLPVEPLFGVFVEYERLATWADCP